MTSAHTKSLVTLLQRVAMDGTVPRGWDGSLADRLRDLMRAHDSDLKDASDALRQAFQEHMAALDDETRDELLGVHLNVRGIKVRQAYRLGQIGFANLIVTQAASKRAGKDFKEMLTSPTHRRCIESMYYGEKTTSALATFSGKRIEPTSRNLSILRKMGISEFRKVATHTYNFLTPAAQQAFKVVLDEERKHLSEEITPTFGKESHKALNLILQKLPPTFREAPSFGSSASSHQSAIP